MFGKWNFPWLALVLFSSLAAAVRADELLEPIAQDDTYLDQDVEPQAPSRAARIKAQMVNDETVSSSSSIVPDVQQCAWADDDCGWASKVRWLTVPVPLPANFCLSSCRWVAGTEVTFLAPSFRGSSVSTTLTDGVGTTYNAASNNSYNNFTYAPRLWLGKQGECWGFMTRFWYLSDSNAVINPYGANGLNNGLSSFNRLKAYTIDLEAQRMFTQCDGGRCFLTFGARYASLTSSSLYNPVATLAGPDFVSASAGTSGCFNGMGLTTAFYGYKPICCSDFSVFYSVRNSIIFGNSESQATTSAAAANGLGSTATVNSAIANGSNTMYIGEIQLGVQWNHQFKCLPMNGFFRIAGEYQVWDVANSTSANSVSVAGIAPTTTASATAHSGNMDLSFLGFAVATGCTW